MAWKHKIVQNFKATCSFCNFESLENNHFGCYGSLGIKLTPQELSVLRDPNLNFRRLCKLEKWSSGVEILVCGGRPSYLSNKTILAQKEIYG